MFRAEKIVAEEHALQWFINELHCAAHATNLASCTDFNFEIDFDWTRCTDFLILFGFLMCVCVCIAPQWGYIVITTSNLSELICLCNTNLTTSIVLKFTATFRTVFPQRFFSFFHSMRDLMQLLSKLLNEILADNDGINIHWNHLNPLNIHWDFIILEKKGDKHQSVSPDINTIYKAIFSSHSRSAFIRNGFFFFNISQFAYSFLCALRWMQHGVNFNLKLHFIQVVKR